MAACPDQFLLVVPLLPVVEAITVIRCVTYQSLLRGSGQVASTGRLDLGQGCVRIGLVGLTLPHEWQGSAWIGQHLFGYAVATE